MKEPVDPYFFLKVSFILGNIVIFIEIFRDIYSFIRGALMIPYNVI